MEEWNIGDPVWWGDGITMPENNGGHVEEEEEEENFKSEYLIYQEKAWKLNQKGHYYDALDAINEALRLRNNSSNWNIKGIILHNLAFEDSYYYEKSINCYNRALKYHDSKIIKNNKAICLCDWTWHFINNRQYLNAFKTIHEALALYKKKELDYAYALNAMGVIYNRLNKPEKAEYYYKQALIYDPENEVYEDNLENIPRAIDNEYIK